MIFLKIKVKLYIYISRKSEKHTNIINLYIKSNKSVTNVFSFWKVCIIIVRKVNKYSKSIDLGYIFRSFLWRKKIN